MDKLKDGIFSTVCSLCFDSCGMLVEIENSKIKKVKGAPEHPFSKGELCVKGLSAKEIAYSKDRLSSPLKRNGSKFDKISWDEALDIICCNLAKIKDKSGPESLAVYFGDPITFQGLAMYHMKLFCNLYGTNNLCCTGSLCNISKVYANLLTYGRWASPDYENTKCVILWGTNPIASSVRTRIKLLRAKDSGAKIIVIDSRYSHSAKLADLFLQPRPGTDGALAMAMLNVIIKEGLYDREFVEKYTHGFEELGKEVENYPPVRVAEITTIASDEIVKLARIFAETKPASIDQGSALEQHTNSIQNVRAVACLLAITGNLDVSGGNIFSSFPQTTQPKPMQTISDRKPIGTREHPLFTSTFKQAQAMVLPENMRNKSTYPIRAMIFSGANPAMTWPDSKKTEEFLEGLEFLVVMDTFMTRTARFAKVVLPASTFLERDELNTNNPPSLQRKFLQVGVCWPDWRFYSELIKHLDLKPEEFFDREENAINFLLKPLNLTYKQIAENPFGFKIAQAKPGATREKGFPTKSGKIELSSEVLKAFNYNPLPLYTEPSEAPKSSPDIAKDYPIILTTGARTPFFTHSQMRNIPKLLELHPEPFIEINPATAKMLDIKDGELVSVETQRGKIKIKAKLTEKIKEGVTHIPHGWEKANVNILTDIEARDPISGFPSLKSLLCRITKC